MSFGCVGGALGHFELMDVKSCAPEGVEHQWQEDIAVQLKEVGMPEQIEANASVGDNVSSRTTCRTAHVNMSVNINTCPKS